MTLLPVIERELRAESRSAFTYWLRVAGGVSLVGVGLIYFLEDNGLGSMEGAELFQRLHVTLFIAIWIVALLMTADSISRERREGTLGLLFLTPLKPFEVVLAKGLAHGLRTATVMLAAVPVLVVPFLMGGVGWREALAAVLIDFSALCCALAAGLFASSFNRTMTRALVWAVVGGLCALVVLVHVHGAGLMCVLHPGIARRGWGARVYEDLLGLGLGAMAAPGGLFGFINAGFGGTKMDAWLVALAVIALGSVMVFGLVVVAAAQGMKLVARERAKSAARQRVEKELFTPTFGLGFYRRWMRRLLERNPVGWIERRTWQARLVTWSWLAVVISLMSWMLGSRSFYTGGFSGLNMFLAWVLVGNVALTAAGSLRRERETGVIELLLVSPLSIPQIVGGRVRSIVGQFLPAAALIFGSWLWLLQAFRGTFVSADVVERDLPIVGSFLVTLLTMPVVGLYFSLCYRMFVVALFWTAATAIVLPWLVGAGVSLVSWHDPNELAPRHWQTGLGVLAVAGSLTLLRGRGAGSPGLSWALAVTFAVLGAISLTFGLRIEQRNMDSPRLAGLFVGSGVQIGIAAWLGARLRRRLETRQFALPQ
jgi:ABC-type transport system involved in multi-copper enzyme maturation permease subunit